MSDERLAFVVRVWHEAVDDDEKRPSTLRGSLQRVDNNDICYFRSLDEIPNLMRQLRRIPKNN